MGYGKWERWVGEDTGNGTHKEYMSGTHNEWHIESDKHMEWTRKWDTYME